MVVVRDDEEPSLGDEPFPFTERFRKSHVLACRGRTVFDEDGIFRNSLRERKGAHCMGFRQKLVRSLAARHDELRFGVLAPEFDAALHPVRQKRRDRAILHEGSAEYDDCIVAAMPVRPLHDDACHGVESKGCAQKSDEKSYEAEDEIEDIAENRNVAESAPHKRPDGHMGNHRASKAKREHVVEASPLSPYEPYACRYERHDEDDRKHEEEDAEERKDCQHERLHPGEDALREDDNKQDGESHDSSASRHKRSTSKPDRTLLAEAKLPEPELAQTGYDCRQSDEDPFACKVHCRRLSSAPLGTRIASQR